MKFMTKKVASEVIRETIEKESTMYFGQRESKILPEYIRASDMKNVFRSSGFGEAETNFIIAAMVKAGAKFTVE